MVYLRKPLALLLGLCLPAGLIAWMWTMDWRWSVTGLVLGLTAPFVAPPPLPRRRRGATLAHNPIPPVAWPDTAPWPDRENL